MTKAILKHHSAVDYKNDIGHLRMDKIANTKIYSSKKSLETRTELGIVQQNKQIETNLIHSIENSLIQSKCYENGKVNSNLELSNKELLDKYGRKEEYEYFGVKFRSPLIFLNMTMMGSLHLAALYGAYMYYQRGICTNFYKNLICFFILTFMSGFGVTAGVHRYWTHRSYKANLPMRILLAICYSLAGQNPIPVWVRNHRVHHKYSETDADPHNSNRGFFFAHVGWLMMKKHPAVREKEKLIDMSDVLSDPVARFHEKYYVVMYILFCFLLPTFIPVYFWNEDVAFAFFGQAVIRYVLALNFTWNVNSLAHLYGNKPYDRRMNTVQNRFVSIFALGEGWHNYHHAFPWDYKAAELPYKINLTTYLLDAFAKIGWVYDRKTASPALIKTTSLKYGDGTHEEWGKIPIINK